MASTTPPEKQAAPTARFSFTKVIVDDLDQSAAFYKTVFGMRELERIKEGLDPNTPIEEIILTLSGDFASEPPLILFKFLTKAPPMGSDSILGFIVDDMDAVITRLKLAGGEVVRAPAEDSVRGIRVAFGTDTDGRLLEIVQMLNPPA